MFQLLYECVKENIRFIKINSKVTSWVWWSLSEEKKSWIWYNLGDKPCLKNAQLAAKVIKCNCLQVRFRIRAGQFYWTDMSMFKTIELCTITPTPVKLECCVKLKTKYDDLQFVVKDTIFNVRTDQLYWFFANICSLYLMPAASNKVEMGL